MSSHTDWHHRPKHVFMPNTSYIITAATLHKQLLFKDTLRLEMLESSIATISALHQWELQAWAIFPNHYHLIAASPDGPSSKQVQNKLKAFVQQLHSETARELNKIDVSPGRQVWFQYRDTCLTFEKSYFARLNYVMNNPVKHGLVKVAHQYRFCSAGWFLANADQAFVRKVMSFGWEQVRIDDDY